MNTTETSPGWQAGFASGHLALPSDCALAGYGVPRQAQKEHDPLLVQAAVLEKPDGLRLLYVNLDVLAVDELLISTIRQEAARAGLETGHLLVQAIHTHCGPAGILRTDQGLLQAAAWFAGLPDAVLVSSLAQSCVQVLLEAEKNLQPVLVSQSRATCQGFTSNRVLEKEIASPVYVLEAATPSQKACFVFAASHPTVLGPDTLETSADLVWGLRKALQKDGYDPVFYVNGACGDLSCRYTRRAATFEEAERLGTLLADCVLQALQGSSGYGFRCRLPAPCRQKKRPLSFGKPKKGWSRHRKKMHRLLCCEKSMSFWKLRRPRCRKRAFLCTKRLFRPVSGSGSGRRKSF